MRPWIGVDSRSKNCCVIGRTASCLFRKPLCKSDCYPTVTNGTRADSHLPRNWVKNQCLTVQHETEGRRALCDLNAKSLASLLGLLWDQERDDVYSRLECRQLESRSHSHLEGCFKRLSAQEMWHLSSSHEEFIPVSVLTKPSRHLCRKHSLFLTTVTVYTCN